MKKTNKIVVVVVALVAMLSCLCIGAFAAYTPNEENYNEILELYEGKTFANEGFDESGAALFSDSDESFKFEWDNPTEPAVQDGFYTLSGCQDHSISNFFVEPDGELSFGYNFGFKNVAADTIVRFYFGNEELIRIIDNTLFYNEATAELAQDAIYDCQVFYSADTGVVSVAMTARADGAAVCSFTKDMSGTALTQFGLKGNRGVFVDYIEAYEGSFSHRLNDIDGTVASYIVALVDYHKATATLASDWAGLENIVKVVMTYEYTTENLDGALKASVEEAIEYAFVKVGAVYADYIIANTASFDKNAAYYDRAENLENINAYADVVKYVQANYPQQNIGDAANINKAYEALDGEANALAKIAQDTVAYIELVKTAEDPNTADFKTLKTIYDKLSSYEFSNTYTNDEVTAEDIEEAERNAYIVIVRYGQMKTIAETFVENVQVASNEYAHMADRYNAYLAAKNNMFADESYNDYIPGVNDIEGLRALFDEIAVFMEATAANAKAYSDYITGAKNAANYAVKAQKLADAYECRSVVDDNFPGIAQADAEYLAVEEELTAQRKLAENYIRAAITLKNAKTYAAKKEALEKTKEYYAAAQDPSVPISLAGFGVANATMLVSTVENELKVIETNCAKFIEATDAIKDSKDFATRRANLLAAKAYAANVDVTIDGVSAAMTAYNAAVASYNADVKAANGLAKSVNDYATDAVSSTAPVGVVEKVVAIIKKFYA